MKQLIYAFIILVLVCSYTDYDDNASENSTIQTYWLKVYDPIAITGVGQVIYNEQDILWTFDFQNKTIKVDVFNDAEAVLFESGLYDYTIEEGNCSFGVMELIINNTYYGDLFFLDGPPTALTIEDICFSARRLVFEEI